MLIVAKRSLLVGMIPKRQVVTAEETFLGPLHNGNYMCRYPTKSIEENPPMRNNNFLMNFQLTSVVE